MKRIRNSADLAINGAAPAFEQPLHVGRPNIGNPAAFLGKAAGVLDRRWLTNNGPLVQELEQRIADYLGVKHCVAMCNGTIALEIAIRALKLDGEVIVPSYTFIATAHALSWQGITPVFADIDPSTHNIDPDEVRQLVTDRTTGIIGVHLWGRPAAVDALQSLANERGLALIFDAAHAFGCSSGAQRIGSFGNCEVLSFHATKVFNTFEGGAITTNDNEIAQTARLIRNFGFSGYDNVIHRGTNGKMPEINAAMGLVNLDALPVTIDVNRRLYDAYCEAFAHVKGVQLLPYAPRNQPNYQYIVIEVEAGEAVRDRIVAALHAENILARKYFWPGCHRMAPYRDNLSANAPLPNTTRIAGRVIVLPTGPTCPDWAPMLIANVMDIQINGGT